MRPLTQSNSCPAQGLRQMTEASKATESPRGQRRLGAKENGYLGILSTFIPLAFFSLKKREEVGWTCHLLTLDQQESTKG